MKLPAAPTSTAFSASRPCGPADRPDGVASSDHGVYEVLNELHGLAVWAQERRDSS